MGLEEEKKIWIKKSSIPVLGNFVLKWVEKNMLQLNWQRSPDKRLPGDLFVVLNKYLNGQLILK